MADLLPRRRRQWKFQTSCFIQFLAACPTLDEIPKLAVYLKLPTNHTGSLPKLAESLKHRLKGLNRRLQTSNPFSSFTHKHTKRL
ncbi:hypothetical protein O6P43_033428 [Quillaja saponaria]|uniref:Uncharacterized protein n=1 Tax=Quillaja saponaria TaxID=32244 RepID=A0AAD7KQQ0_QUISA|nr:hypothetical protein O6P43_033428 [Quillaja saponaria]